MKKMIYLDNAATTPTAPEVIEAMLPFYEDRYGNPSAMYDFGQAGRTAVEEARKIIADSMGVLPEEIYFTAGGSESDNWALKSTAENLSMRGRHIVTSKIEHHAILKTCDYLEQQGYDITYLDVDEYGIITPEAVKKAIRPETVLISVMTANNEIGTIEPIAQIGALAHRCGICFHTDAVQAYGHIPIHADTMHIDMLSASAHKFNGPKGVGFLYVRNSKRIPPLIHGGGQERANRAGTENVPGIVGMGKAAYLAHSSMRERAAQEIRMRDYLIYSILKHVPYARLNGDWTNRLPNNVDFCFADIEGGNLLIMLDMDGICASAGSACSAGSSGVSHVLSAIGVDPMMARGALRLTLNEQLTIRDADYVVASVKKNVEILRKKGAQETVISLDEMQGAR